MKIGTNRDSKRQFWLNIYRGKQHRKRPRSLFSSHILVENEIIDLFRFVCFNMMKALRPAITLRFGMAAKPFCFQNRMNNLFLISILICFTLLFPLILRRDAIDAFIIHCLSSQFSFENICKANYSFSSILFSPSLLIINNDQPILSSFRLPLDLRCWSKRLMSVVRERRQRNQLAASSRRFQR